MMNRLQPTAEQLAPTVRTVLDELEKCDCLTAQMSGSGTACFGICRHARHAGQVASRMRFRGFGRVFAVSSF